MLVFIYAAIYSESVKKRKRMNLSRIPPYLFHDTLMEMIRSEAKDFFSGSLTTLQVVSAAVRQELYIAE